jgi:hypothetical protein
MNDDLLKAVRMLEQFSIATTRQEHFQKLRDSNKSEVFDNFISLISSEDPTINKTTGKQHTVESMVAELQERVGLDSLLRKRSNDDSMQLSRRASILQDTESITSDEELEKVLSEFCKKYFLARDHGLSSAETMLEELKSAQNGMRLIETFGRQKIYDLLHKIADEYPKDNPMLTIPDGSAVTMPAADQMSLNKSEVANIGLGGPSSATTR